MGEVEPLTYWGLFVARHGVLVHLLAFGSLCLEMGYPLALFNRGFATSSRPAAC
jgi:hypothetical protein